MNTYILLKLYFIFHHPWWGFKATLNSLLKLRLNPKWLLHCLLQKN